MYKVSGISLKIWGREFWGSKRQIGLVYEGSDFIGVQDMCWIICQGRQFKNEDGWVRV